MKVKLVQTKPIGCRKLILTFIIEYFRFLLLASYNPASLHLVPEKLCSHGEKMRMTPRSQDAS
jgi:hypothetical protein